MPVGRQNPGRVKSRLALLHRPTPVKNAKMTSSWVSVSNKRCCCCCFCRDGRFAAEKRWNWVATQKWKYEKTERTNEKNIFCIFAISQTTTKWVLLGDGWSSVSYFFLCKWIGVCFCVVCLESAKVCATLPRLSWGLRSLARDNNEYLRPIRVTLFLWPTRWKGRRKGRAQ